MTTNRMLLFNRLEVKYWVDRTTRTALTRDLLAFMRPDPHAGEKGGYLVRSLYFDTPDCMSYSEKLAGMAVRHKLRTRAYGENPSETPIVRYEVKSRYLSYIYKTTVDIPRADYEEVDAALQRRLLPPARVMDDAHISKEFFRLQRQYNMVPKVLIQYRRDAFERVEQNRVRVNFDDELYATSHLDLLGPLKGGRRLQKYGHAIFEIKVDNVMPFWLHQLISKYNLQSEAISKYCFGMRSEAKMSATGRPEE
jgi:SPX domain protein involved in polyphosphate accumulation